MADLDDIFGYQVYKPPAEKEMNLIEDLNFRGEVITLIDANEDVIQNEAVQQILQSLDGERTVKIEDLPPDIRYDGFNKKAMYDEKKVNKSKEPVVIKPAAPKNKQNLFTVTSEQDNLKYNREAIRQAQLKAAKQQQVADDMLAKLKANKHDMEKKLKNQLIEALDQRARMENVTPQHQALIEKLYLELRLINPELALRLLQGGSEVPVQQTQYVSTGRAEEHVKHSQSSSHNYRSGY